MARTAKKGSPTRAGKAKPAKSVPRKKGAVPRKAAGAAARKAAQDPAKGRTKPAPRKLSKPKAGAKPRHDAKHDRRMEEVRRTVARRRPGMAPMVSHEHQDPSIVAPAAPPVPPVDTLRQNWGDAKEKGVTRNDKPTNWFRQAPKPPQKK